MPKTVSIVVPHYNDLVALDTCLERLGRQTVKADEIIVADNNSPAGEAAVATVIAGRAKLIIVAERGAGPARNGGVAAATCEVLAFTDSDCVPEPDWLERGLAALDRADFVGGAMRVLVSNGSDLTPTEAFECVFAFDNEAYVEKKGFTVTANFFCPRAVFDAVGGFRVGVPEDLDWCWRAAAAGYRITYAGDAIVGHPARRTWAELTKKWRRLHEEGFRQTLAERHGRAKWLLKALVLPVSALAHTPKALTSRNLSSASDRAKAIATLFRLRTWRALDALRLLAEP